MKNCENYNQLIDIQLWNLPNNVKQTYLGRCNILRKLIFKTIFLRKDKQPYYHN